MYVPCDSGVLLNSVIMAQNSEVIYAKINNNISKVESSYEQYLEELKVINKTQQLNNDLKAQKIKILLDIIDVKRKINEN